MRILFLALMAALASPTLAQAQSSCSDPVTTTGGVVLTFDDKSIQQWHDLRPIFQAYNVAATFFISRYESLTALEHELLEDLASDGHEIASHSRNHGNAANYCPDGAATCPDISETDRANTYINEQVTPHLAAMAADGYYPRNFAYPYGANTPESDQALKNHFGFVRDTRYSPNIADAHLSCEPNNRLIGAMGFDDAYGNSIADFENAMNDAMCNDTNLVLYGHQNPLPSIYSFDPEFLEDLFGAALARGLTFRRLRDVCAWQVTYSGVGSWTNVHDSPLRDGEVRFADFDGDGRDDALRTTGTRWYALYNHLGSFYQPDGTEHWEYINSSGYTLDQLEFGDFDGDGETDVFRTSGGRWYVSYSGTSAWTHINNSGYTVDRLEFGDFNGDGETDVFLVTGSRWYVSYSGTGRWTQINTLGYALDRLRFADFDGDGDTDVFMSTGGRWYVSYSGTGSWTHVNSSGYEVANLAFGDFDGDGETDVFRATGSRWYVSYSGTSRWNFQRFSSDTIDELTFADFDGDGTTDILRTAAP